MKKEIFGTLCEKCPKMASGQCPNMDEGWIPWQHDLCQMADHAYEKNVRLPAECKEFPCDLTKLGPVNWGFCRYLAGKAY